MQGSQRPLGAEQVLASPRTTWVGGALSGRGGARIGLVPEVAGREAGTGSSEGLLDSHPPKRQTLSCLLNEGSGRYCGLAAQWAARQDGLHLPSMAQMVQSR